MNIHLIFSMIDASPYIRQCSSMANATQQVLSGHVHRKRANLCVLRATAGNKFFPN